MVNTANNIIKKKKYIRTSTICGLRILLIIACVLTFCRTPTTRAFQYRYFFGRRATFFFSGLLKAGINKEEDGNVLGPSPSFLVDDVNQLRHTYYALRHGQSNANIAGIIVSNPDVACNQYGLSEQGQLQAKEAGNDVVRAYKENEFNSIVILTSDFRRAKETAQRVAEVVLQDGHTNLYRKAIIVEPRLRERWFGQWDLSSDRNYGEVWKDDAVDATHTSAGVESAQSVAIRASECILQWDKDGQLPENSMVVCVAHGDVLQIMQTVFERWDQRNHRQLKHLETAKLRRLVLSPAG